MIVYLIPLDLIRYHDDVNPNFSPLGLSKTRLLFVQVPCRCRWAWVSAAGPQIRWIGPAKLLCAKNANPTPSSKPSN